jgi:hypothetical protein
MTVSFSFQVFNHFSFDQQFCIVFVMKESILNNRDSLLCGFCWLASIVTVIVFLVLILQASVTNVALRTQFTGNASLIFANWNESLSTSVSTLEVVGSLFGAVHEANNRTFGTFLDIWRDSAFTNSTIAWARKVNNTDVAAFTQSVRDEVKNEHRERERERERARARASMRRFFETTLKTHTFTDIARTQGFRNYTIFGNASAADDYVLPIVVSGALCSPFAVACSLTLKVANFNISRTRRVPDRMRAATLPDAVPNDAQYYYPPVSNAMLLGFNLLAE